ncbi:MAG TPA: hypothetical protein P5236_04940, partial [Paludibacteraceae bacterium]|nr:hypothetical protein [Paludibacteraceae bacterium]
SPQFGDVIVDIRAVDFPPVISISSQLSNSSAIFFNVLIIYFFKCFLSTRFAFRNPRPLFHTATRELISGEITAPSYWLLFSLSVATGKKITMFFYYLCNAFSCGICDTSGLLPQILLFAFLAREGFL